MQKERRYWWILFDALLEGEEKMKDINLNVPKGKENKDYLMQEIEDNNITGKAMDDTMLQVRIASWFLILMGIGLLVYHNFTLQTIIGTLLILFGFGVRQDIELVE